MMSVWVSLTWSLNQALSCQGGLCRVEMYMMESQLHCMHCALGYVRCTHTHFVNLNLYYSQEKMLNSLCYWLGSSHSSQSLSLSHASTNSQQPNQHNNCSTIDTTMHNWLKTAAKHLPHIVPGICKGPRSQYNMPASAKHNLTAQPQKPGGYSS